MTKTSKIALSVLTAGAIALSLVPGAQAAPVTGSITFAGGVTLDTASAGTATEVVNWFGPTGVAGTKPVVVSSSGSFAADGATFGSAVTFSAPWAFNTSTPITSFWSVAGFTFSLTSSHIFSQGGTPGSVTVDGTGYITGNGLAQTVGSWSFSTQDPSAGNPTGDSVFSFSAATGAAVPEAGTTAILLGLGLMGLVAFGKFRTQSVA